MDINQLLQRKIQDGKKYEPLFPQVACDSEALGSGNTFETVKLILQMVRKYQYQTAKLSPLLKKSSLKETVNSIYNFLYNHLQYKADKRDQLLRSPACAFKQRISGVDCKTYSIFASCILSNLGIKHYIRQIKQPTFNPELYTHVYVVIPTNQTTGSLKTGYLIIDGTTRTNNEPIYTMAADTNVSLPHFGLNAARSKKTTARKPVARKTTTARKPAAKKNSFLGKAVLVGVGALGGFLFAGQKKQV